MIISDSEYSRLKAIEAAHARAVDVQSKWRAVVAASKMSIYLDSLNELRGALMYQEVAQHRVQRIEPCPEGLHEALIKMTGFKHCGYCGERHHTANANR